jgi:hypothetical protein
LVETGLEYWYAATTDRAVDSAAVDRLAAHPRSGEAMRRSIAGALAFYDADPKTNAMFLDLGSMALAIIALYLDASGGLTHRRLKEIGQTSSMLSGGRASAILALMRLKGFIRREHDAHRQVLYRPEAVLRHWFLARFEIEIQAQAVVAPEVAPLVAMWKEPGLFERWIRHAGEAMVRVGTEPTAKDDGFNRTGAKRAGSLILFQMMQATDRGGEFPRAGPFALSVTEIAKRFSVSRSHVLRVLRELEREGFMTRPSDGEGALTPNLPPLFRRYWAITTLGLLACAHHTLDEIYNPK